MPVPKWLSSGARILCIVFAGSGLLCLNQANPATAGELYSASGVTGGPRNLNAYQGLVWAPFGTISATGPIVRAWAKSMQFFYKTSLPNQRRASILALGTSIEGEAGWQLASEHGRIAAYAGIVWRDHMLTPNDPGSKLTRARTVFSATVDGEWRYSSNLGIMANANYLTGLDQFWAQVKPYYSLSSGLKIGFNSAFAGGPDYTYGRLGLFVSGFEMDMWAIGRIYLGAEAGVHYDLEDDEVEPYAGIHVGRFF